MVFMRGGESKDKPSETFSAAPDFSETNSARKDAYLGKGTKVVGSVSFAGSAEVDGYIEGELQAQGRLIIGEAAVINAKIHGTEIVIRGTVNGDIVASSRLYLQKPAKVIGNVKCASLGIEEGVAFEGKCTMDNSESTGKTSAPPPNNRPTAPGRVP